MALETLVLKGCSVLFPNFRGEKGQYNQDGDRRFSVVIEDIQYGEELLALGWALRPLVDDDMEIRAYHLPIKINYRARTPPRIYKLSMNNQQKMFVDESNIEMLDYLPIEYVDVSVNPYAWSVQGKSGYSAYLKNMYVVIEEDELDLKWANFGDEPPFEEDEI